MMKKRLMSIASPHKRSKVTVMLSVAISLLLLVGAAYAGAYTGAPATEEPAASTPVDSPVPEATEQLTPGERLDNFLSDMDELKDSIGEKAQEWGDKVADKAAQWAEEWDWSDAWDWIDQWDWAAMTGSDDYMFGSYHSADRTVVHEGYYQDGYILHLKYDSSAQPEDDASVLAQPAVLLSEDMAHYGEDSAFLPILQGAVDEFVAEHSQLSLKSGVLRLMNVYGPYSESPDALLARFYQEDKLGHFVAVLNSGTTSPEQQRELLYEAADDKNIAFFSALLGEETPTEDVDALLQKAYDNRDVATFYVLLDYASTGARQSLKDQATRDGRIEFLAGIEDKPSEEAIDAMIEGMADLDSRLIAVVSEYLTEDQALRIATAAYEQDNVAAFSIVMDRLNDEDVEAFHEQAHQDGKAAFYAVTGG